MIQAIHTWIFHLISKRFTLLCGKVIGATFYNNDPIRAKLDPNPSPIDDDGHGSHIASTIVGASIAGASFYGLAKGIAQGGVPSARIAMYKVCSNGGCSEMDLLVGLDDAIDDGIDMLSISIGGSVGSFLRIPFRLVPFMQ